MFNTIEQRYLDKLSNRKTPFLMEKAELVVPDVAIGAKVNVVYSFEPDADDARFSDIFGRTTEFEIVRIKRNGTFVLANGYEFRKDGTGLSKNSAMTANKFSSCPWNDVRLSKFDRDIMLKKWNPNYNKELKRR